MVVVLILIVILIISFITYRIIFYVSPKRQESNYNIPATNQYDVYKEELLEAIHKLEEVPYEQIFIKSSDGKTLAAKYYHVKDNAPIDIEFHGYRGTAIRDFCGGYKIASRLKHNILLVDQRAHGKSEGTTITFGIKERYDCLSWINYVIARFGSKTQIFLYGVSMGAATVVMATGLLLPKNVIGVVADCPYSSAQAIIRKVCRDMKIMPNLIYPFIFLGALIFGHFNLNETSALKEVQKNKIPILFIHGDDDLFVPYEMTLDLYRANKSKKEILIVSKAGHGLSYLVDPVSYQKKVDNFLKQVKRI